MRRILIMTLVLLVAVSGMIYAEEVLVELDVEEATQEGSQLIGDGLNAFFIGYDGSWIVEEFMDAKVIQATPSENESGVLHPHGVYFVIDEARLPDSYDMATITVEYFDGLFVEAVLEYNSPVNVVDTLSEEHNIIGEGSEEWKTHSWVLKNADFNQAIHGLCDFRIYIAGMRGFNVSPENLTMLIRRVAISFEI